MPDILVRAGCDRHYGCRCLGTDLGSRGIPLGGTCQLADVSSAAYDLVYLPGGMGSAEFCRDTAAVQDLAEAQLASGRLLAVICACPIALVPRTQPRASPDLLPRRARPSRTVCRRMVAGAGGG